MGKKKKQMFNPKYAGHPRSRLGKTEEIVAEAPAPKPVEIKKPEPKPAPKPVEVKKPQPKPAEKPVEAKKPAPKAEPKIEKKKPALKSVAKEALKPSKKKKKK